MKMGTFILGVAVGLFFGWAHAHKHIAAECERLGGFFVGEKIYKCERVIQPEEEA